MRPDSQPVRRVVLVNDIEGVPFFKFSLYIWDQLPCRGSNGTFGAPGGPPKHPHPTPTPH